MLFLNGCSFYILDNGKRRHLCSESASLIVSWIYIKRTNKLHPNVTKSSTIATTKWCPKWRKITMAGKPIFTTLIANCNRLLVLGTFCKYFLVHRVNQPELLDSRILSGVLPVLPGSTVPPESTLNHLRYPIRL